MMNVCELPPEENVVRFNALKKFAWNGDSGSQR